MWSRYKILSRVLLLVVTALVIVYFMPHEHAFTYDYSLGKPWKYSPLIAEYDFPIYKSDEQMAHERDSVLRGLKPFFNINSETAALQVRNFMNDAPAEGSTVVAKMARGLMAKRLAEVYERGVMSQSDYDEVIDSFAHISVVNGSQATVVPTHTVFSPRQAYQHVTDALDSANVPREVVANSNISNYITPNLEYDRERTASLRHDMLANVSATYGMVQIGQKIIDRGEIVTPHSMKVLNSMQREAEKRSASDSERVLLIAGQFLCVLVLLCVFMTYLMLYRQEYATETRSVLLLFSLILIFTVAASLVQQPVENNVYIVPFAMAVIFIRVFMDSRTAFSTMLIIISICSLSLRSPYEFMLLQIVAGLTAIYSLKELSSRSHLMRSVLLITAITILIKLGYDLSQGFILSTLDLTWYVRILINGVLLLFAYPLMLLFEKLFGFISNVTLVELSNINTPLLRRLSTEAQGTFNHSLQVANLASEVAAKIGGDVQVVRTAALYHDIGKLNNPAFFTENQAGVNPHDNLPEEQSAQIIIRHVTQGMEMADKYRLPSVIKECIATHHGRGKTKFFYINYVNKHPDEAVNEELFTYPGPNPQTKEQAVLMMADSVEAASRSLKEINEDTIRKLVDNIVDQQVKDGFFRDCPITFRDITVAKDVLITSLKTMYHARISYPTLNTEAAPNTTTPQNDAANNA